MNRTATQEVNVFRKVCYALIALGLALIIAGALLTDGAKGAPVVRPHVIQTKWLTASKDWQTWTSTDRGYTVAVDVNDGENPVPQYDENACRASYVTPLLKVSVRLTECHKPGRHPFVVRYRSTVDGDRFRVRLTEVGR